MILGTNINIWNFKEFIGALHKASVSVCRVSQKSPQSTLCSGWLITDELVIVPEYTVDRNSTDIKYECEFYYEGVTETIEAHLDPWTTHDQLSPAILQLSKKLPYRYVALEFTSIHEIVPLFILHYPGGVKELMISMGEVKNVEDKMFHHLADTEPGSSGAPIFSIRGHLIGMHEGSAQTEADIQVSANQGLTLHAMLDSLSLSPKWNEIASVHGLATAAASEPELADLDIVAEPEPADDNELLQQAAVNWHIDPEKLSVTQKKVLETYVINSDLPRWTLNSKDREKIIAEAGSVSVLRNARHQSDFGVSDAGQKAIDDILENPDHTVANINDEQLPYWLQASRWFGNIITDLPSPQVINKELQRRRIRNKLIQNTGTDFKGRKKELDDIAKWYQTKNPGPLIISGIGGIGKSALISKFAVGLPEDTLLYWLDFDRADLVPHDAVPILNSLIEQTTFQVAHFNSITVNPTTWKTDAETFGKAVSAIIQNNKPPLLVLDGFEIAQYSTRYNELWEVLQHIMNGLPALKVIVCGRAPVKALELKNKKADSMDLKGMRPTDAREWLKSHNITEPSIIEKVIEISRGIPLVLVLAAKLVEEKGDVMALPNTLPESMIEGYLYQRILDRVVNPSLVKIAQSILVVRRISPKMLNEVFKDQLPPEQTGQFVFQQLMQEMGLVNEKEKRSYDPITGPDELEELQIRPEVRKATLKLLGLQSKEKVAETDRRAMKWYEGLQSAEPKIHAEIVYHALRTDDLKTAASYWKPEIAKFLSEAVDEIPEDYKKARTWLQEKLSGTSPDLNLDAWELETYKKIRTIIETAPPRIIRGILSERLERTYSTSLFIYDAWMLEQEGMLKQAREKLALATVKDILVEFDRLVMGALFSIYDSQPDEAEEKLARAEKIANTLEKDEWGPRRLLVRSARIHIATDIGKELDLSKLSRELINTRRKSSDPDKIFLKPEDIMEPSLHRFYLRQTTPSSYKIMKIPSNPDELEGFILNINLTRGPHAKNNDYLIPGLEVIQKKDWYKDGLELKYLNEIQATEEVYLSFLAWKRWQLITTDLYLHDATMAIRYGTLKFDQTFLSILSTLAAFIHSPLIVGPELNIQTWILNAIQSIPGKSITLFPDDLACDRAVTLLEINSQLKDRGIEKLKKSIEIYQHDASKSSRNGLPFYELVDIQDPELKIVLLAILSPSPLEVLVRQVLGVSFKYKL